MEKIRSFISIDIPKMSAVKNAQKSLRDIGGISVPEDVHLTLRFLDDVEPKKLKELSERMRPLERYQCFNVSMKGLGAFPNAKDPRVIWIGAELGEPFKDILSELDGILEASSVFYDNKPFKAHITVGRVKTVSKELIALLNKEKSTETESFTCLKIFLMGSKLTSNGPVHSVIDTFRLNNIK